MNGRNGFSMSVIIQWDTPPWPPTLAGDELHIWCADLDEVAPPLDVLSHDERERAARFHFARDRIRYSAGRAILRTLLARYLPCEPGALTFRYEAHGKPVLENYDLDFNLAHSQRLALYAVTRGGVVGIDVEKVRAMPDLEQIAAHFFAPDERTSLSRLPDAEKTMAFFGYWTSKEAYLKAHGGGLSWGLDKVVVNLDASTLTILHAEDAHAWSLHRFTPAQGYLAALATRGPLPTLRYYRYHS
jgi:4'-phosphopantetheinyl transferase